MARGLGEVAFELGVADKLVTARAEAAEDLQNAHFIEPALLEAAPALGPVTVRAKLAAAEPGQGT